MKGGPGVRGAVEEALRRSWRGERDGRTRLVSAAALPLSVVWRGAMAARNAAYDRGLLRPRSALVPVVSVGNLAVGGTGKTPVAAWISRHLADAGVATALVARGYGEDELALHRRWNPDVPVHADPDRVAAAARAAAEGAGAVVLDDGFQHRRLARDLDLVLLAAEHPFPAPVLPRGPFREPVSSLHRAHAVVVTRKTATAERAAALAADVARRGPHLLVARVDLVPGTWVDLDGAPADAPDADALAVTGVAGPEAFRRLVADVSGAAPELLAFRDHHDYDAGDAERILRAAGPRTVVTTEKDAVKLGALRNLLPPVRVLPLEVRGGEGADALLARVRVTAGGGAERRGGAQGERT